MPRIDRRRLLASLALLATAVTMPACRKQAAGDLHVIVIGDAPKLRDPALAPLAPGDALLYASVAQGLVRFDAAGNIVAGLAERWNVSDDGLSYIFRLKSAEWPSGRKVTAEQVARAVKRQIGNRSVNPLKDTLGAVEDVVAMTDRVIEIRLKAPRPNLLALLAQPELGVFRNGEGSGPFAASAVANGSGELRLRRDIAAAEDEIGATEEIFLSAQPARQAVAAFKGGKADLVLGGTFADLPVARGAELPRASLRYDPASGLFGLAPVAATGPASEREVRQMLSQAIDRAALVTAFGIPGLTPRATVLEPALDGVPAFAQPAWSAQPLDQRRVGLVAQANRLFAGEKPILRVLLPEGPGADLLLARLGLDWGVLGFQVERARNARSADLRLVDMVAPSTSPAWFLRNFRCGVATICDPEADELLNGARDAAVPAQRYALLSQAATRIEDMQLFIPLTAPVRWSLVAPRITGFAGNRYGRHTLTDLQQAINGGS